MRSGIVIVGVVLIVVGLLMVSYLGVVWNVSSTGLGIFSPQVAGLGLMVLGFLVFIAGLAASPTERVVRQTTVRTNPRSSQSSPQKQVLLAICPSCKSRIPVTSKFCPECGEDLKPKIKKE